MTYDAKQVIAEFRTSRGQSQEPPKPEKPKRRRNSPPNPYEVFLKKYGSMDTDSVEKWGTQDLVFYFRKIAENVGYKYVISNIRKDMSIMKRLKKDFTNGEICAMIEFLYMSEQDYLSKDRLSVNLLGSNWVNTIYADMLLWVKDEYSPKKKRQDVKRAKHEWASDGDKDSSKIGVTL